MVPPKAKGRSSRFMGERGEFLDAMAGEFMNATDRGTFYSLAASRYVQKFGYAVYGDPPDLETLNPSEKQAELECRKKFLPWLRTTLGGWFRHKYGGGNRTEESTLNKILSTMREVSQQRPQKPKILHRYSQVHYKDRIKPSFDAFWENQGGAIPKSQRLAVTKDFVQKTWASETDEFRAEFEAQVDKEFEDAIAAYSRRFDDDVSTPEAKLDAWYSIDSVLTNLADALGQWVGGSVHIDIVAPLGTDHGQIHVKSVQSRILPSGLDDWDGDNQGADTTQLLFAEWDPDADQDHKEKLVKYGTAIFSDKERVKRIIPVKPSEDHSDVASFSNGDEGPNALPVANPQAARKNSVRPPPSFRFVKEGPRLAEPSTSSSIIKDTDTSTPSEDTEDSHRADVVEKGEDGLYHFAEEDVTRIARAAILAAHSPPSVFSGAPNQVEQPLPPPRQSTPTTVTQPTAAAQYLYGLLKDTPHVESGPSPPESQAGSGMNILSDPSQDVVSSLTTATVPRNTPTPPAPSPAHTQRQPSKNLAGHENVEKPPELADETAHTIEKPSKPAAKGSKKRKADTLDDTGHTIEKPSEPAAKGSKKRKADTLDDTGHTIEKPSEPAAKGSKKRKADTLDDTGHTIEKPSEPAAKGSKKRKADAFDAVGHTIEKPSEPAAKGSKKRKANTVDKPEEVLPSHRSRTKSAKLAELEEMRAAKAAKAQEAKAARAAKAAEVTKASEGPKAAKGRNAKVK